MENTVIAKDGEAVLLGAKRSVARALTLCAVVVLLPAAAWAAPWHTGARAGLSLTNIHGDFASVFGPANQLGFQGGGFVEFSRGPVGFALEMNYVEKGFTIVSEGVEENGIPTGLLKGHVKLRYLEVPVLVRAPLALDRWWEPYAVFGPTFGFALGGEFEPEPPGFAHQDVGDDLKSVDMGGTAGVGATLGRGLFRMMLETRYSTGFSDLWDFSGNLESINHGFGFTVGVVH
jgi:hypothetical protein